MRRAKIGLVVAVLAAGCTDEGPSGIPEAAFNATASAKAGPVLYALTADNTLLTIDAAQPNRVLGTTPITGLMQGEVVMGIDYRPSDLTADGIDRIGALYAVTSQSRFYIIDPATGTAGEPVTIATPVSGTVVGFGFNPAADRVRIHGSDQQNLRVNPDNGVTLTDGTLTFDVADANAGRTPQIAALGYTNSDADPATGTSLYAIGLTTGAATRVGLIAQTRAAIVSLAITP
jgi:hypothetical protein